MRNTCMGFLIFRAGVFVDEYAGDCLWEKNALTMHLFPGGE